MLTLIQHLDAVLAKIHKDTMGEVLEIYMCKEMSTRLLSEMGSRLAVLKYKGHQVYIDNSLENGKFIVRAPMLYRHWKVTVRLSQ